MIKKILLAMDGSENAERALWWVIQYAGRGEGPGGALPRGRIPEVMDPGFAPSR